MVGRFQHIQLASVYYEWLRAPQTFFELYLKSKMVSQEFIQRGYFKGLPSKIFRLHLHGKL